MADFQLMETRKILFAKQHSIVHVQDTGTLNRLFPSTTRFRLTVSSKTT